MNNCYLIISTSNSLIEKKIKELIKENNFKDSLITSYDLESDSISDLLEDADTISFLTENKTIIGKNTKFLESGGSIDDKDLVYLNKYLDNPNPSVLLIFTATKLDERKKLVKELSKKIKYINLSPTAENIINESFNGYKIDFKTKKLLEEYYQNDLERLISEIEKLKLIFIENKNISYDKAVEVLEKPNNNQDNLSFSLVRSMALKNKKEAIKTYQELLNYNIEPYSIMGLLESQYRLLYQVKVLNSQNISSNDMNKILNVHPFRIKKTLELASYYTNKEIAQIIKNLEEVDYDIKSGNSNSDMVIELLILNL